MTSRQAPPGQRPPPTRALSGSIQLQRQAQQRSHLQNALGGSSPRNNVVDLTGETSSPGGSRSAQSARPGSGLRLEAFQEVKDKSEARDASVPPSTPMVNLPQQWLRGKPRWMSDVQVGDVRPEAPTSGFSSNAASPMEQKPILSAPAMTAMPLPARPTRRQVRPQQKKESDVGLASKKETTPKPFVMEVPADAPIARGNVALDYFPWTGNHAEDRFSDSIIRSGYSDKSSENTNTAKQGIYPSLRNKSTLQMMNSLFSQMLNERRKLGIVDAPPTFKPPPRVTLPDTKRESWLRDLAMPSVPLKRLSRSIPHGIKNRVLLDQCAIKEVPIERAIWLAKCVGANEIRASRRKVAHGSVSLGGEARWLKEWTSCVVQFLEAAVVGCGDAKQPQQGRERMGYCLRLVDRLYAEGLLDEPQYLDLQLTALEKTSEDKLLLRLLVLQPCRIDLLRYRKTGRRYAASLCSHLQKAHESVERDLNMQLIDRLHILLIDVLKTHPENFISSKKWPDYSRTILACNTSSSSELGDLLDDVGRRNKRLASGYTRTINPKQDVIKLLDSIYTTPFTPDLGKKCWQKMEDKTELAQVLLDWATSIHRPGVCKVFTAARLLRIWSRHGLDVHTAMIELLIRAQESSKSICKTSLYQLFSELARSGQFSTSKYVMWLIARGGVQSPTDVYPDGPCVTRLLAELPLRDLSDSAIAIRTSLLRRASFSVDYEAEAIDETYSAIESCLPRLHGNPAKFVDEDKVSDMLSDLSDLSRTITTEIGHLLRSQVRECLAECDPASPRQNNPDAMDTDHPEYSLDLDEFICVRSILERTGSIAMLADILKLVASHSSSNTYMLASVADTISTHRDSLASIGALKDLSDLMVSRYQTLVAIQAPDSNTVLYSLYQLARRVPAPELVKQLKHEVARSYRNAAVEACSPVSDHVAEVLANAETDLFGEIETEEIEKMLYSGSSMDTAVFNQLFDALTGQVEGLWTKGIEDLQPRYSYLLTRLRAFDETRFGSMLSAWITRLIQKPQRPLMELLLRPLVAAGCISFLDALRSCYQRADEVSALNGIFQFATNLEILDIALGMSAAKEPLPNKDCYTMSIRRLECQNERDYCSIVLNSTRRYIEDAAEAAEPRYLDSFKALCQQKVFISALQRLILAHYDAFNEHIMTPLARSRNPMVLNCLRIFLRSLLHLPITVSSRAELLPASRIEAILNVAKDLTLPFCQLALHSVLANENITALQEATGAPGSELRPLEAFDRAVDQALVAGNMTWASIIPQLDQHIAQHLSERAERVFLETLGSIDHPEQQPADAYDAAKRMRIIMDVTGYSMRGKRSNSTVLSLVERIKTAVHLLQHDGKVQDRIKTIEPWLPLILAFAVHIAGTTESNEAEDMKAKLVVAISTLHLVVRAKNLGDRDMHDNIFDTIIHLADDLSDATLERIGHFFERHVVLADRTNTGTPAPTSTPSSSAPSGSQGATSAPHPPPHNPASIFAPLPHSLTASSDPALRYALSLGLGRPHDDGLVLVQKSKPTHPGPQTPYGHVVAVTPFQVKKWENLTDPTPNVGENDASLNLKLFEARRK